MDSCCEKCSLAIDAKTDLFTVCEGMCAKSFHAECVGLTESDVCALSSNVIWLCNPCMKVYYRIRERSSTDVATNTDASDADLPPRTIVDDVTELKNTVADIVCTLAKLAQKSDCPSTHHCSSPISSFNLFDGTNEIGCSTKRKENLQEDAVPLNFGPPLESTTEVLDEDVFALYLTNIDRCTTEDDISLMISRQLGIPLSSCLDVVKLLPKWKNVNTLDYVSFKIRLNKSLKATAMNSSTWPKGIKFREFVCRLNETWKPV